MKVTELKSLSEHHCNEIDKVVSESTNKIEIFQIKCMAFNTLEVMLQELKEKSNDTIREYKKHTYKIENDKNFYYKDKELDRIIIK